MKTKLLIGTGVVLLGAIGVQFLADDNADKKVEGDLRVSHVETQPQAVKNLNKVDESQSEKRKRVNSPAVQRSSEELKPKAQAIVPRNYEDSLRKKSDEKSKSVMEKYEATRRKLVSDFAEKINKPGFVEFYHQSSQMRREAMMEIMDPTATGREPTNSGPSPEQVQELLELDQEYNKALLDYVGIENEDSLTQLQNEINNELKSIIDSYGEIQ